MSALLCCLYLATGLSYMAHTPSPMPYGSHWWYYDITHVRDPYGVVEGGYSRSFGRFALEFAARHESSIPAADFGQNTLEMRIRWYPWRPHDSQR